MHGYWIGLGLNKRRGWFLIFVRPPDLFYWKNLFIPVNANTSWQIMLLAGRRLTILVDGEGEGARSRFSSSFLLVLRRVRRGKKLV